MTTDNTPEIPPSRDAPARLKLRASGPMTWPNYALDTFIAPYLSQLTSADIPDRSEIAAQAKGWLGRHILRSMVQLSLPPGQRSHVFRFLRRSTGTVRFYEQGRLATLEFLEHHSARQPAVSRYAAATDYWDAFLAQGWQAVTSWFHIINQRNTMFKLFKEADGSLFERLHGLYTDEKHAESRFQKTMLDPAASFSMWMTTAGLVTKGNHLDWIEAAELVDYLAGRIEALETTLNDIYHAESSATPPVAQVKPAVE